MCSERIVQIKCQHVTGVAVSVRLKFHRLGTVGSRAVYVWFMVRYTAVQRYEMPVGHPET